MSIALDQSSRSQQIENQLDTQLRLLTHQTCDQAWKEMVQNLKGNERNENGTYGEESIQILDEFGEKTAFRRDR